MQKQRLGKPVHSNEKRNLYSDLLCLPLFIISFSFISFCFIPACALPYFELAAWRPLSGAIFLNSFASKHRTTHTQTNYCCFADFFFHPLLSSAIFFLSIRPSIFHFFYLVVVVARGACADCFARFVLHREFIIAIIISIKSVMKVWSRGMMCTNSSERNGLPKGLIATANAANHDQMNPARSQCFEHTSRNQYNSFRFWFISYYFFLLLARASVRSLSCALKMVQQTNRIRSLLSGIMRRLRRR